MSAGLFCSTRNPQEKFAIMELIFEPGQIPFNTEEIHHVTFYTFAWEEGTASGIASVFTLPELTRFLALRMKSIWWMVRPNTRSSVRSRLRPSCCWGVCPTAAICFCFRWSTGIFAPPFRGTLRAGRNFSSKERWRRIRRRRGRFWRRPSDRIRLNWCIA